MRPDKSPVFHLRPSASSADVFLDGGPGTTAPPSSHHETLSADNADTRRWKARRLFHLAKSGCAHRFSANAGCRQRPELLMRKKTFHIVKFTQRLCKTSTCAQLDAQTQSRRISAVGRFAEVKEEAAALGCAGGHVAKRPAALVPPASPKFLRERRVPSGT